jgi:hypothetical protein
MTACHGLLQIQRDQAGAVVRHGQQWIGLGLGWPKRAPEEANRYFARLAHFGRQIVRSVASAGIHTHRGLLPRAIICFVYKRFLCGAVSDEHRCSSLTATVRDRSDRHRLRHSASPQQVDFRRSRREYQQWGLLAQTQVLRGAGAQTLHQSVAGSEDHPESRARHPGLTPRSVETMRNLPHSTPST